MDTVVSAILKLPTTWRGNLALYVAAVHYFLRECKLTETMWTMETYKEVCEKDWRKVSSSAKLAFWKPKLSALLETSMATGGYGSRSEGAEENFSCPVCLEILENPISIPCGHT